MRAEFGTKPSRFSRRLAQLRHNSWKTNGLALARDDGDLVFLNHAAHPEMRVVDDVGSIVNRPGRHACLVHRLHHLVKRMTYCPVRNDAIKKLLVTRPAGV